MTVYFKHDYGACREQFRELASTRNARQEAHPITAKGPDELELTIDTAYIGSPDATRVLMLSSGMHGVEGFAGSAIQAQFLAEDLDTLSIPDDGAVLMVHAINPFGFAWLRRVNESNVDLNRNFLDHDKNDIRRPDYIHYYDMINPTALHEDEDEWFMTKAMEVIAEHGAARMQAIFSEGQYEKPQGVYYGGNKAEDSNRLMRQIFVEHVGQAKTCHLIDFHTGLGPSGEYTFLSDHPANSHANEWLRETYAPRPVEVPNSEESISAALSGEIGGALQQELPDLTFYSGAAEFGTVETLEVGMALRLENWLWHHGDRDNEQGQAIVQRLVNAFRPDTEEWRTKVLAGGRDCIERAWKAFFN